MEEQTTWKGHTFTLLVFTGIVVLCSIFFILGMLVGRAEAQKGAVVKSEAKVAPKADKEDFASYGPPKHAEPTVSQPEPAKPEPAAAAPALDPPKKAEPAPEPAPAPRPPANMIHYQVGALAKAAAAEKLLNEVKKKGFPRAFIIEPAEGDPNPVYRVQVGPFSDMLEAQEVKKKLESAGFPAILKK